MTDNRKLIEEAKRILAGNGKPAIDACSAPRELYVRHLQDRCSELYGVATRLISALEAAVRGEEGK